MTGPAEEHRHPAAKRQRTNNQRDMTNEENFQGGDRRGQSAVGGELRLDVSSCLTQAEADILSVITEAVKLSKLQTVVRVAGGWVRDKLLGLENEDIDIALDNCTGVTFAEIINAYLKSQGQAEGKVAVIEANPEQSKHLETARMKINGVWIDLVNLRTETYNSDSRIPETSFGTAEEDALRRDFTLNALFYNVNEAKVEDMTGRGVDDLRMGIIRTPLPPMITFQDDPLRLLRAVRFASRFGFTLHEDLRAAAQDSKIQAALGSKVSRERVGAELSGMLTGKMAQPALALSLLYELGLAPTVYALPEEHLVPSPPEEGFDWGRGAAVARAAARVLAFRARGVNSSTGEEEASVPKGATPLSQGATSGAPPRMTGIVNGETGREMTTVDAAVEGGAVDRAATADGVCEIKTHAGNVGKVEVTTPVRKEGATEKGSLPDGDSKKVGVEDPKTAVREIFLCSVLLPLANVKHRVKKGKLVSAAQSVVQEALKLKAKEAKNVGEILDLLPTFRSLVDTYETTELSGAGDRAPETSRDAVHTASAENGTEFSRLAVGLVVRQAKELWPTCVDLCCAVEMCEPRPQEPVDGGNKASDHSSREKRGKETGENDDTTPGPERAEGRVIIKYMKFAKAVTSMGLGRAWENAPLVRGNELMNELQVPKGPQIGQLMTKQASWQLENPQGSREQCLAFLKTSLST